MARILAVVLSASFLLGASDCSSDSGGETIVQQSPQSQPVYESADLGTLEVLGTFTEARARFTLGADELPIAVIVEGDFIPANSNTAPASAELVIFDSRGDQDPNNDLLVGMLSPSPFNRAPLSADAPGSFTVRTPLAGGSADKVALCGGTWSARLRISTSSWFGTVTSWRLRVLTMKRAEVVSAAQSFVRDQ